MYNFAIETQSLYFWRIKLIKRNIQNFDIHIDKDGKWFHKDSPIKRIEIVKLFSSVLYRDDIGKYWLETPAEKGTITVEDVPFIIIDFKVKTSNKKNSIFFTDNLDRQYKLSKKFPIVFKLKKNYSNQKIPYLFLGKGLFAKISRSVFYELVKISNRDEFKNKIGIWSDGIFFELS